MDNNRDKGALKGKMLRGKPRWARGREPRKGMPRGYFSVIILRGGVSQAGYQVEIPEDGMGA